MKNKLIVVGQAIRQNSVKKIDEKNRKVEYGKHFEGVKNKGESREDSLRKNFETELDREDFEKYSLP